MLKVTTWLMLFFSASLLAQDFSVKGKLMDKDLEFPLESATVFVEKLTDSTLITYSISDQNGEFLLRGNTGVPKIRLNISYTGYSNYTKVLSLDTRDIDLGTIEMETSAESLKSVIVQATRAPVTIKKDTLEFNVASFKTKKDANVEDLLKELPGVEVDETGAIKVNGKPVNKILVNGKPFFGDDPTIATRNLTKEIVDKIQVVDTKTESEAFTGEAGDDENKTINITIDEEKNKGIFGRVAAGVGTDKRFEYAGLFNYFNNDTRISVLGGGNNINSAGFSFGEIQKMFGNSRYTSISSNGTFNVGGRSFGGGEGIVNSRTAGVNYADDYGKETDLTVDYFYSASNSFNDELRNRENILPDNRYFSNTNTNTRSETDSHTVNLNFKTEIDSTFQIEIRPQFNYRDGVSNYQNAEETTEINGDLRNNSNTTRISESENRGFENRLTVTKKYGSKGGYFRVRVENDIEEDINDNRVMSTTNIFGDMPDVIERNQLTDGDQKRNEYKISTQVSYPIIADTLFVTAEYEYTHDTREDAQRVFDFNDASNGFTDFNLEQSTDFTNVDRSSRPELGIRYNNKKLRASASVGYVIRTLESDDALRDIAFENDFNAVELRANVSYRFTKKLSLYSGYSLNNRAPSVSQLSPFVDVSNPLNIITGNPDLKPTNSHYLYMGLNNYDFQTQSGFYSNLNAGLSNDAVVSRTLVDENFVRNTTFDNVDGNYNFSMGAGFNKKKKLDSIRSIKYNVGMRVGTNRTVNFNNDVQYKSTTTNVGPSVGVGFVWEDLFEFRPSYELTINRNTFDLDQFEDRDYINHEARLRTTLTYPKDLEWSNDILFNYNPDVADGFQRSAVFWNSTLAYSILKDQGTITIKAYDLLKQNTNARRTSRADYIQDVQSTVLQQYFMLSFSYKFNTLGKKGESRDDNFYFN